MPKPLSQSNSLAALRNRVEHCRRGRGRAVFPQDLKRQIVSQLSDHSPSQLARALDIGTNSLSRWKQELLPPNRGDLFVNLTPHSGASRPPTSEAPQPEAFSSNTFQLNLTLQADQNTQPVTLCAQVTREQWQQVLMLISQALLP